MRKTDRALIAASLAGLLSAGCVERTISISTRPEGARVFINDEEVGLSPVKRSFLWYGDYEIVVRKDGYETARTNVKFDPPWYQIPPIDFISEVLVIGTIRDDRVVPTIELSPTEVPPADEVVQRAMELRERAMR